MLRSQCDGVDPATRTSHKVGVPAWIHVRRQPLGQRPEGLGGGFIRLSAEFYPRGVGMDLRRPTGVSDVEEEDQASGYFTREIHSW